MNASGNFSRRLSDFSPLGFCFEFEFSSAQPLVLFFLLQYCTAIQEELGRTALAMIVD
jgi:hypothetical protein